MKKIHKDNFLSLTKKEISSFYDSFLAEHDYKEDFSSPRLNFILRNIKASDKNSPVLDVGCGAGSLSRLLAET